MNMTMAKTAEWIHRRFLLLLLCAYGVAAFFPAPGLGLRHVVLGRFTTMGAPVALSLPTILLGVLLFNAGLGVRPGQIRGTLRRPGLLLAGLVANALVPIGFIFLAAQLLGWWHNSAEAQCVLLGLSIIAAMPVAGSSTAWSQNANGDLALSLGLVLGSTLLSPLTTPLILRSVAPLTTAEYTAALYALAGSGTGVTLGIVVASPAILGIVVARGLRDSVWARLRSAVKVANAACLLILVYSNAAVSLPEAIANPDPDFLALIVLFVAGLSGTAFLAGGLLGRACRASKGQRAALIFGLGMNNNGTGLVLAGLVLADHPRVLLPVIVCNLLQHILAGAVDRWWLAPPTALSEPANSFLSVDNSHRWQDNRPPPNVRGFNRVPPHGRIDRECTG
jgi:bile acid:Na+ symporter, BASS family